MGVLSIDLFILRDDIDFKIASSLPLMFPNLNPPNFLLKDSIADNIPQQSVADNPKSLIAIDKVPQEKREIADKHEECPHCQPEHFIGYIQVIFDCDDGIHLE